MRLYEDRAKVIGIILCAILGLTVLCLDLIFSHHDEATIHRSELVDFNNDWEVTFQNKEFKHVTFPVTMEEANVGDTLVLTKSIPTQLLDDTFLFFRAIHQKVKVFINDKEVYSFGWNQGQLFGKSPGCVWVVTPISRQQAGEQLKIELTGTYETQAKMINGIFLGEKDAILNTLVTSRIGSLFICVVLMVLGVMMILIALVLRRGSVITSLFRLGIFSVLVGVWSSCVINLYQVIYGNVFALLNFEFLSYHLILPVALWFLMSFESFKENKILKSLFWASILLFIAVNLMQIFNIADYLETLVFSHILMGISVCYQIFIGVRILFRKKASREARLFMLSIILLLGCLTVDLFRYYTHVNNDEGFYTRIGMLVFILLWVIEIIRNMSKVIEKMTRNKLLEVIAYEDQMTGLNNRTAFEERCKDYREGRIAEEAYMIEFDMNNLKLINDNFGHAKGDEAIITIANIIKSEFSHIGACYRIGGDEICAIVPATAAITDALITQKIHNISLNIENASCALELEFSVACGYSKTSRKDNLDIDGAYKVADKYMYENKHYMKQQIYECP